MNRGLTSFDIYVIVSELQELVGSYLDKIYQISRSEIIIRINNKNKNQKENIYVRNGELFCITQKRFEAPKKPPTFAMTLRKYLLNGKISKIVQYEFDRIIKINVLKKDGEYTLVFELFKNGNIILLDPERKIILPLYVQRWSHRKLKTHEIYTPPPSQINPFDIKENKFLEVLVSSDKDIVRTLASRVNLGGVYSEEICFRAGIDKNTKISDLSQDNVKKVYSTLMNFLKVFSENNIQPAFVKKDKKIVDILPFPFQSYSEYDFEKTDSFCIGLEKFIDVPKKTDTKKSIIDDELQKLQRQIVKQKKTIKEYSDKITQKKSQGDVLYLNYQACEDVLYEISQVLKLKDKKEKIKEINQKNIVKSFNPTQSELIVILKDEKDNKFEIQLDFRKTITANAEKLYNQCKKLQDKIKGAEKALNNTEKKIKTLEKNIVYDKEEKEPETKKIYWFEKFRWFISTEGNIIIAGRDARGNEQVVKKYLKAGDRYVHADVHGAPSCVIKNINIDGKKIPISEKTLKEACIFAASYSKAWKQFVEAQVYWVLPEQVSKTPQSGEFLPKGSFVIRGKRNYQKCEMEIAIGLIEINGIKRIMSGPQDSIKARSSKFVILKPGVMNKSVLSKKLSNIFHISTTEIDRVLPPGEISIVDTSGFEIK